MNRQVLLGLLLSLTILVGCDGKPDVEPLPSGAVSSCGVQKPKPAAPDVGTPPLEAISLPVSFSKGSSSLTISGTAFYEDKPYNASGFTGAIVNTPIRQAIINLIANDGNVLLASRQTGEDGSFTFSGIDNSAQQGGVHLQIQAKNASDSASPAEVRNSQFANPPALLAISGPTLDDSVSNNFPSEQIIASASDIGGAFNILDNFLKGGAFIKKPGFCPTMIDPNAECKAPFLTAYWQPGGNQGSVFDPEILAISLCGGGGGGTCSVGDTDEYDDTIVLHEYGHFITSSFSHDNSPGGSHGLSESDQDIRLSWSEGWATFFASAVLGSPLAVDTGPQGFSFDIDIAGNKYITNEVSVSAILWDVFDAPSPDDDLITTIAFPPVWKSFVNIPTATTTMEQFAFLFMADQPASVTNFQTILTGRSVELFPDTGESAGESTLIVGNVQEHTLYLSGSNPVGDEDVLTFSVTAGTSYTVKTFNLTNGADTFLTVKDGGSFSLTNDNASGLTHMNGCGATYPKNGLTTLSSSITFNPTTGGTFFVHVKRSPTAPLSTGLTGSYDIRLTSP